MLLSGVVDKSLLDSMASYQTEPGYERYDGPYTGRTQEQPPIDPRRMARRSAYPTGENARVYVGPTGPIDEAYGRDRPARNFEAANRSYPTDPNDSRPRYSPDAPPQQLPSDPRVARPARISRPEYEIAQPLEINELLKQAGTAGHSPLLDPATMPGKDPDYRNRGQYDNNLSHKAYSTPQTEIDQDFRLKQNPYAQRAYEESAHVQSSAGPTARTGTLPWFEYELKVCFYNFIAQI